MLNETITIINKRGLHARAAAKLVTAAAEFKARVQVRIASSCDSWADGKSVMSLMLLAATQGTALEVQTDGIDEEDAMSRVRKLIEERFEEDE